MKNIFILFISLLLANSAISQDQMIIRIDDASQENHDYFVKQNDEVTAYRSGEYLDVLVSQERYQELKANGWSMEITQTTLQNKLNLVSDKEIEGYHTYDETYSYLMELAYDYPDICSLTDIGDSHGKEYFLNGENNYQDYQHDLWMLKISDNVTESEDEPAVFFFGAHHAREPISTEVVLGIIQHLTEGYGVDDEITAMVDNSEIYIVPIVNPDGHEVVLDQLNTWWRKNAADNDENGEFNFNSGGPDGVDPNRNYGWNHASGGASNDPTEDTYHGPYAFSEPELDALKDLMASHHFTTGITYHSYSELVLYPFGYSDLATAPDHEALEELAVNMAESIPKITGSGHYFPEQSCDLYPASGVTDDWAYGNHGIFCFTVELGQEFIPPAYQVPTIISDNIEAAMIVLNRANHQVVRGHVYDAETLEPIVAKVYVDGIDEVEDFREPYMSNEEFGAYYRLLMSGDFDVTFSAYGYVAQEITDIEVLSDEATILDVYLERAASGPLTGSVKDGLTGEDIEGAEIEFLNTTADPVFTNENGVYMMDEIFYNTYPVRVTKEGYAPYYEVRSLTENSYQLNFVLLTAEAITFEEGEIPEDISFSGNENWQIDLDMPFEGDFAVASGDIGNNQLSTMILNTENRAGGAITFYSKASSESGWDFLKFYIDGSEQDSWSGEADWEEQVFPVEAGDHEYKWSYIKDGNTIGGSDKAWVDYIQVPPVVITSVNAGPDQVIFSNENVSLFAYATNYESVSWTTSGSGNFYPVDDLKAVYSPSSEDIANGNVDLSITVNGTETISDALTVTIELGTSIQQIASTSSFMLSPNPTDKKVNIRLLNEDEGIIEIYNVSGMIIKKQQITKGQQNYSLDISYMNSGVYFVKFVNASGITNIQRLLVK